MRLAILAALGLAAAPALAQDADRPLSAIDWLSQSLESTSSVAAGEPPVAESAAAPGITVTPLDGTGGGLSGVLPAEVTGLPPDLWAGSDEGELAALIGAEEAETVPALQDLLVTMMLAQAESPEGGDGTDLFLARVDKLLDMGALDAARALLESGDLLEPEAFRRWFDVTLLQGTEHQACAVLRSHPSLAPTLMARVFCTARNGDWNAAALTLNTARALGDVTPEDEELLTKFLDPEFAEPEESLLPPERPTPLVYRMKEAVGDLMPTAGLPLAFSHADLRDTVAWRAQIEAAERLARHGAVSENVLLGVYTARQPAASGGVWDRAAAIQALDRAVQAGDRAKVAEALQPAWDGMQEVGLEVPFAKLFGEALVGLGLDGDAGALAYRIGLLSPAYEAAARSREPSTAQERVWRAVALGEVDGVEGSDAPSAAVLAGFQGTEVPAELEAELSGKRVGEAVLNAMDGFRQGIDGDRAAVSAAIATLRAAGLEDVARRAALQFLLLDARA
ncbi:hypothetical protein Rumeso_01587 [Rubellimicrobium mesophilum DSM 19309]|uniref:Antifreeze glycopeptide polyprotein n=1 Tax=Rubellimicrobium mesophilum DSM 19309 TaxID=442562 RepID=A0A017HSB3_9RHOB|nr:hypothetical protein [Rubellimicrobium mesophilum]EYD76629.1 hypothetical protein Rumeso_01587 [Rubellimicrobium mesophilum DSM 19309]